MTDRALTGSIPFAVWIGQDPVERRLSRRTPRWSAAGQAAVAVLGYQHQEETFQHGRPASAADSRLDGGSVGGEEPRGRARR
ncbi:hypothetical protein ACTD5D_40660 [Nocardia takedensis]|uniref:hypothetical protein n=1 Tax=Nocardia takedensis TaxID=259390 RepID=UPI003F76C9A6